MDLTSAGLIQGLTKVQDGLRTEGLTFKMLSRHSNITEWDTLGTQIKDLLSKTGRKPEILKYVGGF